MAKRSGTARRAAPTRKRGSLVCPTCGFKAAHPAGLGRHRSAIHGVVSKRRRTQQSAVRKAGTADAKLTRRVAALERRYDKLLNGLERFVKQARR